MNNHGITLIELLLTITIFLVLGATSAIFFSRNFLQTSVNTSTDYLESELRKAQYYALTSKQNSNWGIHYGNTQFVLFAGSTYATRNTAFDETFQLNPNITVNNLTDLIFTRLTGTPSATPTITLISSENSGTIAITAEGGIQQQ